MQDIGNPRCLPALRGCGSLEGVRRPGRTIPLAAAVIALAAVVPARGEDAGYEAGSGLRASELLPPELLSGPHFRVEEEVRTDGFVPVYTLSSEFGSYQARGEADLRARIREIQALAALREASRSEAFAAAAARAGQPQAGDPVGIAGLPIGAGATGTGGGAGRVLDVEALRLRIAAELGIDPHTTNQVLGAELERHAWVAAVGGMSSLQVPETGSAAAEAPAGSRVETLLRDWSAADLEALNRLELVAMGVDETLREAFLKHPSYSPSVGTGLVEALSALEGTEDRGAFIAAAVEADSREDAVAFERMAQLIRGYGSESGGVQKITTVEGRIAAFAADGTLVVPVLADHALWTERVAHFTEAMAQAAGSDPDVARTRFLVSGRVSPRTRTELQERGIELTEGAAAAD